MTDYYVKKWVECETCLTLHMENPTDTYCDCDHGYKAVFVEEPEKVEVPKSVRGLVSYYYRVQEKHDTDRGILKLLIAQHMGELEAKLKIAEEVISELKHLFDRNDINWDAVTCQMIWDRPEQEFINLVFPILQRLRKALKQIRGEG